MDKMKIGYFADGPWSYRAFELLIEESDLIIGFICVRFDTKDETLKKYCTKYKIDYLKDQNINNKEFLDKAAAYNCDLFVSMSFNQIFKKTIINLPRLGTINCHAGKLPFYRGRNILNWVLINDEKELANIGIYEDNPDEITLIEWPEKMKTYKTNNILDLNFEYGDEYKKRFLTISSKKKVSFLDEFK